MKKVFIIVLILLGLSLSSLVLWPKAEKEDDVQDLISEVNIDPRLEKYLMLQSAIDNPIREFGEVDSYMWMDKDFVTRFLYPANDVVELNSAIAKWINDTSSYYHAQSVDSHKLGNRTELTVDYCSYLINNIASVKFKGEYSHPGDAHPLDVGECFNADTVSGKLLKLEDLLLPEGLEKLTVMLVDKSGIYGEQVDENIFNHWFLTPEGLEITFYRGEYRPMSSGTESFLFDYESLEGILQFPEYENEVPASPEIAPTPVEMPENSGIDSRKPMIALTFDDGPSVHTERLLDILAENGCKATFFVVGNMIDGREETLKRIADDGHQIGGHSWNHRQLTTLDRQSMEEQIMQTRAKIYDVTGTDSVIMRPPYGSYNEDLRAVSAQLGVSLINWSIDSQDWKNRDAKAIHNAIVSNAKSGAIILCHDLYGTTVDAMETIIPALIDKGYQFVTVSELFTYNGGALSTGTVYFGR